MNILNKISGIMADKVRRKKAFVAAAGVMCAAMLIAGAALFVAHENPPASAKTAEKSEALEPAGEVVAPEITDEAGGETGAEEGGLDAGMLTVDTAPKPDEGKSEEYSIQEPKKAKNKE